MDKPLFGNYRAKVVDNVDPEKFGRIVVWIPDIMPLLPDTEGIWARPANNPMGGRNLEGNEDHHYMGTSYIPRKGAWVWVFFEAGNINRPYYFGALDLENAKVLPENQLGKNYQDKWTILKTHDGRTIIISDDPDDARVEITGKKRNISDPPTGDTNSVYTIDGNQTTILFDERSGKEKILIRTHKGDFLHIDIDEQKLQAKFESNIEILSNATINISAADDINLKAVTGKVNIQADSDEINLKAGAKVNAQGGADFNVKSGANANIEAPQIVNVKGGSAINHDAAVINDQGGAAGPAGSAGSAAQANPVGERNT
jgi:hypothetical protein